MEQGGDSAEVVRCTNVIDDVVEDVVQNLLGLVVTLLMPISVSSPTSSGIKSLFSFLSSLIIFKEKFLTRQVVGVIIGAVAVILLNI